MNCLFLYQLMEDAIELYIEDHDIGMELDEVDYASFSDMFYNEYHTNVVSIEKGYQFIHSYLHLYQLEEYFNVSYDLFYIAASDYKNR